MYSKKREGLVISGLKTVQDNHCKCICSGLKQITQQRKVLPFSAPRTTLGEHRALPASSQSRDRIVASTYSTGPWYKPKLNWEVGHNYHAWRDFPCMLSPGSCSLYDYDLFTRGLVIEYFCSIFIHTEKVRLKPLSKIENLLTNVTKH